MARRSWPAICPGVAGLGKIRESTPAPLVPSKGFTRTDLVDGTNSVGHVTACGIFYVKKTSRQKVYCSRRCGATRTAAAVTRKRREKERAQNLRRAQEAASHWATDRTRVPWKQWVSNKTEITVKWLTRAVNRGDLGVPVKGGSIPSSVQICA